MIDLDGGERELHLNRQRNQQIQQYDRVDSPAQSHREMITTADPSTQNILDLAGNAT
jgi:ABC-type siderophore export system fused ATPase/permease subunit